MAKLVLKEQFQQNKRLFVLGGILLFLLLLLFYVLKITSPATTSRTLPQGLEQRPGVSDSQKGVEVLPQDKRGDGEAGEDKVGREPTDPFLGPVKLLGVVVGGGGENVAIIENGGTTYVIAQGAVLDGYWLIKEVSGDSVLLEAGEQEMVLKIK